jgi:hypothetical protein
VEESLREFLTSWFCFALGCLAFVVSVVVVIVIVVTKAAASRKVCPVCGERIQTAARKCRYCGEWLND